MKNIIDDKLYYHGTPKKVTNFKSPTPKRPFFVCKNIEFCKKAFGDKQIISIKFNLDAAKVFDFTNSKFLDKLIDVPLFIKELLLGDITGEAEELYTTIAMFEECFSYIQYAKGSYDKFINTLAGANKTKTVEYFMNNWFLPSINYPIKKRSKRLNCKKIYDIFHWMCKKIKNVEKLDSNNGIFDPKSVKVYSLIGDLYLNDIKKLGYNVIMNQEIKDGFNEKTFGIIDKNAIKTIQLI